MRWNEEQIQPEKDNKDDKKKKEKPRELKKPGEYSMEELGSAKNRPFLGGNYNA